MHTAAGMLLRNYNDLDLDYTDLLQLTRNLTGDNQQVRQGYVRVVFNVLAGNSDDHAKNHAFLLDSSGKWKISPVYDLTPSRLRLQPGTRSTSLLGNKNEKIPLSTLKELAAEHGIQDPVSIIRQVSEAVKKWGDFAKAAGIPKKIADRYRTRMKDIRPVDLK
jgi:serine/threonine-protein kinase HipA